MCEERPVSEQPGTRRHGPRERIRAEGGRAEALGALIRSWANRQDDGEQRETIDCLVDGLDRERLSARKLFPEELEGRSW